MSLVVGWVGVDTHGVASAYLVSDSRISLKDGRCFDYARKVFASTKYPEILGFSGNALFPSIILSQIIDIIDSGLLLDNDMEPRAKNGIIFAKIKELYKEYNIKDIEDKRVEIVHITKSSCNSKPTFKCYYMALGGNKKTYRKECDIPNESDVIIELGSGSQSFHERYINLYQQSNNRGTSRNVFHCFVHELLETTNFEIGGAPQLVGIIRKPQSGAQIFGIVYNRKRYVLGVPYTKLNNITNINWRNMNFELCNPKTRNKMKNATEQPNTLLDLKATP